MTFDLQRYFSVLRQAFQPNTPVTSLNQPCSKCTKGESISQTGVLAGFILSCTVNVLRLTVRINPKTPQYLLTKFQWGFYNHGCLCSKCPLSGELETEILWVNTAVVLGLIWSVYQGSHYILVVIEIQGLSRTLKLHFQGPILDGSLQHEQYYSNI